MPRTSSSRPTPGRGYQTMPAGMVQQEAPRDDAPEWASGPFTLYISYLHAHVPEKMLFSVLRQTGLGMMRRQGAIELTKHDARDGGYPFQSAKIHFDFLFTRGEQREQNLQVLDHLLHGGDDAHFQVVYQAARRNPKTGKDEPDRFWKIKAWREGQRSASPAGSPSLKISLHGGSVGPKDVAAAPKKPTATELARAAARRAAKDKRTADADGFVKPKTHGAAAVVTASIDGHDGGQTVGGGFAALAVSPSGSSSGTDSSSASPNPTTKSAKKNAKRRAAKQRKAEAARAERANGGGDATAEVAQAIAEHTPVPMTEDEMAECDAEMAKIQATPTNEEIAAAAAEFIAENQIREEGAENAAAWQMDASTGSMLFHDEMTAAEAAALVPAHEVLDAEAIHEAIDIAENGAPTAKRAAAGV